MKRAQVGIKRSFRIYDDTALFLLKTLSLLRSFAFAMVLKLMIVENSTILSRRMCQNHSTFLTNLLIRFAHRLSQFRIPVRL